MEKGLSFEIILKHQQMVFFSIKQLHLKLLELKRNDFWDKKVLKRYFEMVNLCMYEKKLISPYYFRLSLSILKRAAS